MNTPGCVRMCCLECPRVETWGAGRAACTRHPRCSACGGRLEASRRGNANPQSTKGIPLDVDAAPTRRLAVQAARMARAAYNQRFAAIQAR